jgi:2-polyprenyl-3-methyl-5-hydroxy-6-metoxy-1,4-benzoquinol methylase
VAREDRERWNRKLREGREASEVSPALAELTPLLSRARALDLAAGWGANAAHLRRAGFAVFTVDIADVVRPDVLADLEYVGLRPGSVDTIVCTRYLERRLIPHWIAALRPGGTIFLETFLRAVKPRFGLDPGELRRLTPGLEILHFREGPELASVLARRGSR